MTRSHKDFDFSGLTPAERILLAQELLDGALMGDDAAFAPLNESEIAELRRRMALADSGRMRDHSWNDIEAELRST